MKYAVTVIAAVLPTFGAALSAIRVHGDFRVYADCSRETEKGLKAIRKSMLAEARTDGASATLGSLLSDRIAKASDAMQDDLAQWHVLSRTRPLSLPA